MKTVCIMCPIGCDLEIKKVKDQIVVSGNSCPRGEVYGRQEFTMPMRVLTTLITTEKGVLPVKTTAAVPKQKLPQVIKQIKNLKLKEAKYGDVIIKNVLGLGADVVVTGNY